MALGHEGDTLPLILASGSTARARMLRDAGVAVETRPAPVDEAAVRQAMEAEGAAPRDIADMLAEIKARRVAGRAPDRLVLGADQALILEGEMLAKAATPDEARVQLRRLRGRVHTLHSAAVIFEAGEPVWRQIGSARLTMRAFSDAFLERYLEGEGAAITQTLGCYRLEAGGAQLFSRIEGDHFSILGLPLLAVLEFLRSRGVCAT